MQRAPYLARRGEYDLRDHREFRSSDGKCVLKTLIVFLDSLVEEECV